MRAFFRPEFHNRIDRVIGFKPLGEEAIRRIAKKELAAAGTAAAASSSRLVGCTARPDG